MIRWLLNLHFCVVNCMSLKLKGTFRENAMMSPSHSSLTEEFTWRVHVNFSCVPDELHNTLRGLVVFLVRAMLPGLKHVPETPFFWGGEQHFWNPDCWAPPPELILQVVWGRAQELVFLTNCQMVLMLLLEKPLSESYWVGVQKRSHSNYTQSHLSSHIL